MTRGITQLFLGIFFFNYLKIYDRQFEKEGGRGEGGEGLCRIE